MAANGPNFWSSNTFEPKRAFRFLIEFTPLNLGQGGTDLDTDTNNLQFLAKAVSRPSYTVSSNPHKFFNHTFHYPGRVEWNTITLTLVDAVGSGNSSKIFMKYLDNIGYKNPSDLTTATAHTITKQTATNSMGRFLIREMGTDTAGNSESKGVWRLTNAFITEVNFGEHSYDSEDMIDVQLTIQYDWANYSDTGNFT
tara:strand:- start:264 stop:854 length:591 start_codon:yes stop_codon:yes gene_type:complete